jgi:hypothetical protein
MSGAPPRRARRDSYAQILDTVARTLRLDRPEREHLYHLAGVPYVPDRSADVQRAGPEIQGIIDALDPRPAVVYNTRYDVLATDRAYRLLFARPGLDELGMRNVLWTLFTVSDPVCPLVTGGPGCR